MIEEIGKIKINDSNLKNIKFYKNEISEGINVFEKFFVKRKDNKINWVIDRICDHNFGKLICDKQKMIAKCPMHDWKLNLSNLNYENIKLKKKTINFYENKKYISIPNKEKYLTFPDNKNDISDDDLIVRYISHATVLISFSGINMLTDPWLLGPAFSNGWWLKELPKVNIEEIIKITDIIFISHNHPDHLHEETLEKFKKNIKIITPKFKSNSTINLLKKNGFKNILLCDFNKVFQVNKKNFFFSILKSGDFKDDSGIFFNINNKKILLNVDSNNLNGGILPKNIDLLMSSYAGGASGFPLCFDDYPKKEKDKILLKNMNAQFSMVINLIDKTETKIFMPYAGFFTELAKRDEYILKNNRKNNFHRLYRFYKDKKIDLIDHENIDTIIFSKKKKVIKKKLNIEKVKYTNINRYTSYIIGKSKYLYKYNRKNEKIIIDYFKKSNFRSNINLLIVLTDDTFKKNKLGFFIDFSKKKILIKKLKDIDIRKFLSQNDKEITRKLLIKVREESFINTILNKLPWEDLLIGFQCRIRRRPNIYNNDFWYHFSNVYIG